MPVIWVFSLSLDKSNITCDRTKSFFRNGTAESVLTRNQDRSKGRSFFMPSVPRVLGGLGDCLPWAYGTSGVRPHNGVERSGRALRRLASGAGAERTTGFSLNQHGSELKRSADSGVGMLPRGFPGAAFSAWWERFTAGVPFWKNGLVPSHIGLVNLLPF